MSANFEELISKVKEYGKKKVSVAVAEDAPILEAEEEARKHGIHLIWVTHNLMCPEDGTRRDMRTEINRYMRTVFREEPLDPSLEDFDDSKSW